MQYPKRIKACGAQLSKNQIRNFHSGPMRVRVQSPKVQDVTQSVKLPCLQHLFGMVPVYTQDPREKDDAASGRHQAHIEIPVVRESERRAIAADQVEGAPPEQAARRT